MRPLGTDLRRSLGGTKQTRVIHVASRQRIADVFGIEPTAMGTTMTNALSKGSQAWESYSQLIAIFERYLLTDARLRADYDKLRRRIAALPWQVLAGELDAQADDVADQISAMLANAPRLRRTLLYELTDAIGVGFAAVEMIGEVRDGRVRLTEFRGVEQWALRPDPARPGQWEHKTELNWQPVPTGKLLVWSLDNKGDPVTGGLLWPCLWLALFKNYSFKDWASFLETYGQPLRVGRYDPASSTEDQDVLARAVIDIAADAGVVIPKGMEIEFINAMKGSAAAYENFVKRIDLYFDILILGGTMTQEAGEKGARSLGEVHDDQLDQIVEFYAQDLAEAVTAGLVVPVVQANFGERPDYPRFAFAFNTIANQARRWQIDQGLIQAGLPVGKNYLRETYDIPAPDDDDDILVAPSSLPPNPPLLNADRSPFELRCAERIAAAFEIEQFAETDEPQEPALAMLDAFVERGGAAWRALVAPLIERAVAEGPAFSNFGELAEPFRKGLAEAMTPALIAMQAATIDELLDDAREEGVRDELDVAGILAETAAALKNPPRGSAPITAALRMAELDLSQSPPRTTAEWRAVSPEKAIEFWATRIGVPVEQFKAMSEAARAYAMTVAGVTEQSVIDAAREGIRRSLVDGATFGDFRKSIGAALDQAGLDPLRPWHLHTVWRQNLLTSYGAGRAAAQRTSGARQFLPYLEYRIADSRARATHKALNGVTRHVDDPIWQQYTPPWEWGCRCRTQSRRRPRPGAPTDPVIWPPVPAGFGNGGPLSRWIETVKGEAA